MEDHLVFREAVVDSLSHLYNVAASGSVNETLDYLEKNTPDIIFVDIGLPDGDGLSLVKTIRSSHCDSAIIMMTAQSEISTVVEAMRNGASDYLVKPVRADVLNVVVEKALEATENRRELKSRRQVDNLSLKECEFVGLSTFARELSKKINVLGASDTTVLLEGETGTGKELIARLIHRESARLSKPFVALNCAAIPKDLIEAELFGYQEGAFTGARKKRIGKFELADNGTLLLDEIADLPLDAQSKLLRILEEQDFYPVGSNELRSVDVRVIASTNQHLAELVEKKLFRADLYYRLNVYVLAVPALSQRPEDIIPLTEQFIRIFNRKFGKNVEGVHDRARDFLLNHAWPGNVRELRNVLERVMLFCTDSVIQPEQLHFIQADFERRSSEYSDTKSTLTDGLDQRIIEIEKSIISDALNRTRGNKAKAARMLQLSAPAFHYRLEKYGMK